jgi:hypothetical protein
MLTGTGAWLSQTHQVRNVPLAALPHVRDVPLASWDKINTGASAPAYQGSYIKNTTGTNRTLF